MIHAGVALLLAIAAFSVNVPHRYFVQVYTGGNWVEVHECGSHKLAVKRMQQFQEEVSRSAFRVVAA